MCGISPHDRGTCLDNDADIWWQAVALIAARTACDIRLHTIPKPSQIILDWIPGHGERNVSCLGWKGLD